MASNDKVRQWFDGLPPERRQKVVKGGVIVGVIVVALVLYYLSGQDDKEPEAPKETPIAIELGDERLEDDLRASFEREQEEQRNSAQKTQAELEAQREDMAALQAQLKAMERVQRVLATSENPAMPGDDLGSDMDLPPPETEWTQPPPPQPGDGAVDLGPQLVGGISSFKAVSATKGKTPEKKNPRVYMPVGFMSAKLLTGVRAKTTNGSSQNPEPLILRVQAPAVLPNEVRAQLEGCLVVAHGYGDLASERVEAALVSLNCLDWEGRSLIAAELTGIVVDNDGVKGLAARPVWRAGANMARLAAAGALQGVGEAVESSSQTTASSALGQTSFVDPGDVGRSAAGQAISRPAGELAKIYADLVKQAAPVLETGPTKDVTVVVTEGTWLEIKGLENGGT